jgi:antitoxin component YwqK of YwqJK toxin-antitoxin module
MVANITAHQEPKQIDIIFVFFDRMKKFGWLLLLLAACNQKVQEISKEVVIPNDTIEVTDELVNNKVDTLFYAQKPFSGTLIHRFPNGNIETTTQYYRGVQHGEFFGYYQNGALKFNRPYQMGEKNGVHRGFYESSAKEFEFIFEKGLSIGNHFEWYESGQVFRDMNFVNGRERGSQKVYRPDGKLRANYVVRENGRKYGVVGVKRCTNLDTEEEKLDPIKP